MQSAQQVTKHQPKLPSTRRKSAKQVKNQPSFLSILDKYSLTELLNCNLASKYTNIDTNIIKDRIEKIYDKLDSQNHPTSLNSSLTLKTLKLSDGTATKMVYLVESDNKVRRKEELTSLKQVLSATCDNSITKSEDTEQLACLIILSELALNTK